MKFASATSYDYKATAKAIREAVVKKLAADESINLSDVTVEYNAAYVGTNFKPLDNKDIATKKLTADEEFTFRLSWGGSNGNGTALYKPFSAEVKLTLVDNRLASEIKDCRRSEHHLQQGRQRRKVCNHLKRYRLHQFHDSCRC